MILFHHPLCVEYGSSLRPEQPARIARSVSRLKETHPDWIWRNAGEAEEADLLLAHESSLLARLQHAPDIDDDTPWFAGIYDHARRSVGAALAAAEAALAGEKGFALMRPPGHHCTRTQAMGFCYLNSIAVAALKMARAGHRVAVWDFDAHHGNGTEDILRGKTNVLFTSVHQSPCYPGTGLHSFDNCQNYPVKPRASRQTHLAELADSWHTVQAFGPDLILVSAGFDAYAHDPITEMTLERPDFARLGSWLYDSAIPAAAILEGGYSSDLPLLIDDFLSAWENRTLPFA